MPSESARRPLHAFSLAVCGATLCQLVVGALVTSREAGLSIPDWPLAYGRLIPRLDGGIAYEFAHRILAVLVTALTGILAVWIWRAEDRHWMRPLGFFALGLLFLQILLGGLAVLTLLPPIVSTLHACIAELFFCLTVLIATFTARLGAPSARGSFPLAIAVPVLVAIQVALGALARHKAIGYIWHIADAAFVTGVILWATVRVLLRHPAHRTMRRSALALLSLAFLQVFLGIAAYMSRLATVDAIQPEPVMVGFTVLHVAVGALVMAASVVFAVEVR